MIKGWRNNPEWVRYYKEKKEASIKRKMERLEIASRMRQHDLAMERLLSGPPFSVIE